ncbi:MAG: hypothetical protein KDK23_08460 [Leptospiraceae bacterium]|nr:hypothetical protein [Leptospiraceae bacterium]
MHTTIDSNRKEALAARELLFFRWLFLAGALWNLLGAVFGYFNTATTYQNFFGRELADPLQFAIYQGSWGTTLLYFLGYLLVAHNPQKHTGIVALGTLGKIFFALKLWGLYSAGLAKPVVLVVIVGDALFSALYIYYLFRMVMTQKEL